MRPYLALIALSVLAACNPDADSGDHLSREELLKPEACKECHPKHYEQWSGSMHAYASKDPVFRAMNARGQREAKLGDFCVNCHAPMAVREGMTKDGTNLDDVPDHLQGVTCYFCHDVERVKDDHNNALVLANDTTMRGGIANPVDPKAHDAAYSKLHDGKQFESAKLCGGCHDIVTPSGVHLERTFKEYKDSFFYDPMGTESDGSSTDTCAGCHMDAEEGRAIASVAGVGARTFHEHLFPAVDVPLSSFPHREAARSAVEDCKLPDSLGWITIGRDPLKSDVQNAFAVTFETLAGHNQPSGAAQDRRMWLDVVAYDEDGNKLFATDEYDETAEADAGAGNPPRIFHDSIYDKDDKEVRMFWQAAPSHANMDGFVSRALPGGNRGSMMLNHSVSVGFTTTQTPARVEANLRIRPIGLDVLQDLVASGDLDKAVIEEMPTFTVRSAVVTWKKGGGPDDVSDPEPPKLDCTYPCMLNPDDCQKN